MGRKKQLTEEEKDKIKAFIERGLSLCNIAKKKKLEKSDSRAIIRAASNSSNSVLYCTVKCIVRSVKYLKRFKIKKSNPKCHS